MAAAETARLISTLEMQDKGFSRTASNAQTKLTGLERSSAKATRGATGLAGGLGKAGSALGGFQSRLGKLVSGPLGMIGLAGGIAGVGKVIHDSVGAAQEFGTTSTTLGRLLNLPIDQSSRLVDTLDKFGISGDKAITTFARQQKAVQAYATGQAKANAAVEKAAKTTKGHAEAVAKAKALHDQFTLSVVDNNGKIVDSNELLKRSADYFNSDATSTQKATTLAKLYGKTWTTLIPLLSKGRAGINKEEASALSINRKQAVQLAALRGAQRELNDTWGDTKVLIGLALVPQITRLSRGLNSFISTHQQDIVAFFEGFAKFAEEAGAAIHDVLLPAITGIAGAWNSLPPDVRKLLLAGFVANKVGGKLFGTSPLKLGLDLGKGLLQRGGSPATPMFTKEVGLGATPGAGGLPGAAGKGAGLLRTAATGLAVTAAVVGVGEVIDTWGKVNQRSTDQSRQVQADALSWIKKQPSRDELVSGLAAVDKGINDIRSNPLNVLVQGDSLQALQETRDAIQKQLNAQDASHASPQTKALAVGIADTIGKGLRALLGVGTGPAAGVTAANVAVQRKLDVLHADLLANTKVLRTSKDPAAVAKAAKAVAGDVTKGAGSVSTTREIIAGLRRQLAATKDPGLRRALTSALARVERKLPGREWIAAEKANAAKVARSNESVGQKIRDLRAIQQALIAHGDAAAARIVGTLLGNVVPAIAAINISVARAGSPGPAFLPSSPRRSGGSPGGSTPAANARVGSEHNRPSYTVVSMRDVNNAGNHASRYSPTRDK